MQRQALPALLRVLLVAVAGVAGRDQSPTASRDDSLSLSWIFADGQPWGVRCVGSARAGLCRAHAHLLLAATAPGGDAAGALVSGATHAVDGGAAVAAGPCVYEVHVIPPALTQQVFTVNYDALLPPAAAPPKRVCISPWVASVASSAPAPASLPPYCMALNVSVSPPNAIASTAARLLFGNWSVVCSSKSAKRKLCRTMGHVALLGAAPGVVSPMAATGAVSFDGGESWAEAGGSR